MRLHWDPLSLRHKFLVVMMLSTLASVFVATLGLAIYNTINYSRQLDETVSAHATFLGRAVRPAIEFQESRTAESYVELVRGLGGVLGAAVYGEGGELFAGGEYTNVPLDRQEPYGTRVLGNVIRAYQPVIAGGSQIATVTVTMEYDFQEQLLINAAIALVVFCLAGAVGLVLALKFERTVTRPILHVSTLARKIVERKDYSVRATKFSDDETGVLVDAFNAMLAEVANRDEDLKASNEQLSAEVRERIEAEKALVASEHAVKDHAVKLEIMNQELESFCYSVSHDLRTPLRAIDGFSQAILEDYEEVLDEVGSDYLGRVRKATQRMGVLIDDLLKLSRVSRSELTLEDVNLSVMVREIAADLQAADPDRDVELQVSPDLEGRFDKALLQIVLENLVGNAWKYTGRTDQARIDFAQLQHYGKVLYYIRDNGAGYDMRYSDKLFGAFQRLHSDADFPGNGIGLATVRRIMRRHGGDIWSESRLGEGAIFYFTLAEMSLAERKVVSLYGPTLTAGSQGDGCKTHSDR